MSDFNADPNYRPPLKLPPGSVRSLLALLIGGMFWLLLLFSEEAEKIPLHIYFLLALLMLFTVSHGKSMAYTERDDVQNPLWLPRWFFRAIIVIGFVATLGWRIYDNPDQLQRFLTPSPEQMKQWPWLLAALAGGFVFGRLLASGPWQNYPMFRDIQAWIAVLAMLGLGAEILIITVIDSSVPQQLDLPLWRSILTGIVACYFGVRS